MQKLIMAVLALIASVAAVAEQKVVIEGYEVHYMALSTAELSETVAQAYGINRSNKQAFLSISVLQPQPEGPAQPVAAEVSGSFRNLLGQTKDLSFRQIEDGQAIYYLAEFRFYDQEVLRFSLDVAPQGEAAQTVNFEQSIWKAL